MLHKSCPVSIKATVDDGQPEGAFEALVSVFGNKDSYGDVVMPGAFTDTLADWASKGDPIPVYWSHRMDDPDFNIGHVLEAKETDDGLWVRAQLDLDSPKAAQVYRLLKGRRVTQFSFAFDVEDGGLETRAQGEESEDFYALRKLKLYEVGPTPIGANQDTELLAVKAASEHATHFAAQVKAGRVLSAKNEDTLRAAHQQLADAATQIKDVLSAVSGQEEDQEKASTSGPAKTEEPERAKAEEPSRAVPVNKNLATNIEIVESEGVRS